MLTQKMALSLIKVAEKKGEPEQKQSYWNAYHCQSKVYSSDNRLYGKYCKNRFCTLCCAIRKADIINKYLPIIQEWEDPFFTTLTVKAVPAKHLKKKIDEIVKAFKLIKDKYRKKYQRGKGIMLMGIKSLECNFNPQTRTYNPHFHLILPNKETAMVLMKEWRLFWGDKYVKKVGQRTRRIRKDRTKDLIEIIKYGSKIFTEPDVNKKSKQKISPYI